ncbi:MAG: hypothetical protein LBQ80_04130 [Clostridium sp.]|jgi:hypothetical protein|nr:hypothetical protein [Clostridium sp.]
MKLLSLTGLAHLWDKIVAAGEMLSGQIAAETNRATAAEESISTTLAGKLDKSAYPQIVTGITATVQEGTSTVEIGADIMEQPSGTTGEQTVALPIASETTGGIMPFQAYAALQTLYNWYLEGGGSSGGSGGATGDIGVATLEQLGLVLSSEAPGQSFAEVNGTLSVNGWDAAMTALANLESAIAALQSSVNNTILPALSTAVVQSATGVLKLNVYTQAQYDALADKTGLIAIVG